MLKQKLFTFFQVSIIPHFITGPIFPSTISLITQISLHTDLRYQLLPLRSFHTQKTKSQLVAFINK